MSGRHITAALLLLVGAVAHASPRTVSVALGGLDDAAYRRLDGLALERQVVLRLVEEGFAVVAPASPAEVRLSLSAAGEALALRGRGAAGEREAEVKASSVRPAELRLEVAQKLVELARACVADAPAAAGSGGEGAAPRATSGLTPSDSAASIEAGTGLEQAGNAPSVVQAVRPAALSALTVGVSPGLTFRAGGLDPAGRLDLRYGRRWGARLVVAVSPALASGLWVLEAQLLAGASAQLELLPRLVLDAGVCLGAQLHAFGDDAAAVRSGAQVAFAASVPVAVTFWPEDRFGVGLRVTGGWVSSEPAHAGWTRGPFSFDAAAVAVVRL